MTGEPKPKRARQLIEEGGDAFYMASARLDAIKTQDRDDMGAIRLWAIVLGACVLAALGVW